MAEILPRSNITKFEDGTNFPYKFCTVFQKMRRELNKTIVQTLKEEIDGADSRNRQAEEIEE